jgi:hypothetical protein
LASAFLIGLDLGTTNTAVAFVDTRRPEAVVERFAIPQLTEPFRVEPRSVLPSFLLFPEDAEVHSGAVALPWDASPRTVAGVLARERGAVMPARQVSAAKSWLAHPGVDRRAAILPLVDAPGPRLSPVDASAAYLRHVRDAWNATVAAGDQDLAFERQRIVLTVPASFDEEARELTVEAARAAGLADLTLLEEPIAAFYAWIAAHRDLRPLEHQTLALVCDVGGGTTDFSLIRVQVAGGAPSFARVAIGDHLLLGGDNVDLALAALVERRLAETRPDVRLSITQRAALRRSCSAAKEQLLRDASSDRLSITILGAGRALVGGTVSVVVTRQDVERLVDEFLPMTAAGEIATPRDRRAGLRELGLPYETDPAITRHLATFLVRAALTLGDEPGVTTVAGRRLVRPDVLLFNGGFFTPRAARDRVVEAIASWFGRPPHVLTTSDLESAVATGAATYARVRAGLGAPLARVAAGSARAYYIGVRRAPVDDAIAAVCVLTRGTEEGTQTAIEHPFTVATNRPIAFALYSSMTRSDRHGEIVALGRGEETHEHAPLVTTLRFGRKSRQVEIPVRLTVAFTEVGTLELWCESQISEHRWRLQFQLRGAEESARPEGDAAETRAETLIAEDAVAACERAIRAVFADSSGDLTPETLVAFLEQTTGYAKTAWPLGVIRRFADVLIEVAGGRRRSAAHEARWLNLFGFCLRPGFGAAKDPWRISESRKVYVAGLAFPSVIQNRVEWLVFLQRAAGGFSTGQQRDLAQRSMGDLGIGGKRAARLNRQMERETWRLLASLERVDAQTRARIGDELSIRLRRDPGNASLLWAMGRLGARTPLYGPLNGVVSAERVVPWVEALLSVRAMTPDVAGAVVQMAARSGDALRDLDAETRDRVRSRLRDAGLAEDALLALDQPAAASTADVSRVFGEPLPEGLRLQADGAQ